jgi:hypothetical protein
MVKIGKKASNGEAGQQRASERTSVVRWSLDKGVGKLGGIGRAMASDRS